MSQKSITNQNVINATEKLGIPNATLEGIVCFSVTPSTLWTKLQNDLLKASYWPTGHADNANFTTWVDALFRNHFSSSNIEKRSLGHRPSPHETLHILEVISKRLGYLECKEKELPQEPSLHILVTGGLVTASNNCETNPSSSR
jgi:hypothetical protein